MDSTMDSAIEDIKKIDYISYLSKGGISIAIIIVFYIIALIVEKRFINLIEKENAQNKMDNQILYRLLANLFYYVIIIIGIIIALVNIGFSLNTLLIFVGSVGLAIALAIQGTVTQIVSGITILFFKYFNVGDLIEINSTMGYVDNFNLLNTTIIDPRNVKIVIPNNTITSGTFVNYYNKETIYSQFFITLSNNNNIHYETLINNIKKTLISDCKYVIDKDKVFVFITDTSEPGTKMVIKFLIKNSDFYDALFASQEIVRNLLANDNVLLLDNNYFTAPSAK